MTPRELKFSILKSAFEGKLTFPMDSDSSSIDLRRRLSEKKKDYLRFLTEEKPFDIPEKWEWVIFGMCGELKSGFAFKASDYTPKGIQVVRISDLNEDSIADDNAVFYPENGELKQYEIRKNSFLICLTGSIGKMAWVKDDTKRYLNQRVGMFVPNGICLTKYLWYFLHTQYVYNQWVSSKTSTNGNIKNSDVLNLFMPLPPLEEQKRIVAKIEELFPLIERYEDAWNKLEIFNKKFPGDMEQSLLNYAFEGKLVKEIEDEGKGDKLFKKLTENNPENKKAIHIKEEDRPFSTPESWVWCPLEAIVSKKIKRGKSPKYTNKSGTLVFAQKCNTKKGIIDLSLAKCLDETIKDKYSDEEYMVDGDIVLNSTGGGTLGRVGVYHDSDNVFNLPVVPDSHVTIIRPSNLVDAKYVFYLLKYYQPYLESLGEGSTNQTELAPSVVASLPFPLPPYKEQKRIVAKLEELLPLCRKLIKQI